VYHNTKLTHPIQSFIAHLFILIYIFYKAIPLQIVEGPFSCRGSENLCLFDVEGIKTCVFSVGKTNGGKILGK